MAATAEAAKMAEGAAIVEVEAVKIAGGGGKQNKSNKKSEICDKTARPDCYFCLGSHKASKCPNHSVSTTAPAISNSQHSGFLGSVSYSDI